MSDEADERRQQDLRDLEFFSQRVRPTVSDLLRTNELSQKNNKISLRTDKTRERSRGAIGIRTPSSLADIYADSRHGAERPEPNEPRPAATTARTEDLWLLGAVAVLFVLATWVGNIDRVIEALVF